MTTPDHDADVVALVLAAGRSTRFGGRKALASLRGTPLIGHAVAAPRAAGLPVLAVVPDDPEIVAAAAVAGARTVTMPDADRGLRGSLQHGLAALPPGTAAAVVLLGDQPGVAPTVITAVVRAWRTAPGTAWRVRYADGPGHPVLLPSVAWPALHRAADGDVGARDLLPDLGVRELEVAGAAPRDIDRPEDLAGSA